MYGASKSNVLKHLEPIQNACLRAITGAFRSSPAASLCVETGMLPLDFSRDMLTLKHFFKIQSLPNSPTHRAVIGWETTSTNYAHNTRYKPSKILTLLRRTPIAPNRSRVPRVSAERRPSVANDFFQKSQLA